MKTHPVKIKSIGYVTHDVLRIVTEKPHQYTFIPGQATEVCISENTCDDEKSPFTFTSLPDWDYLEFIIKTYPDRNGLTSRLPELKKDDELILHDVFGSIAYKGEGVFIAGGAGITPFISILRHLQSKGKIGHNKLLFANKTEEDIILHQELKELLGRNFINILSDEKVHGYAHGQITENFLKMHVKSSTNHVYVCGPPPMMESVLMQLSNLGVDKNAIVTEEF
jgi:ferredoxin-NADP reductase